ncbi:MAG: HEAT repeat domain-containing protein [Planctomycetota bacterium]|jgi:hypothetical protein
MRCALLLVLLLFGGEVDALLEKLASPDAEERASALRALASHQGAEVTRSIARGLGDAVADVRKAAVWALGEREDEGSRKVLRKALERFAKDEDLLPAIVVALGTARDAASARAVATLARKAVGSDARLARAAIDSLGRMRAAESVACLTELLGPAEAASKGAGPGHGELLPDLLESLREVTGLPFERAPTFIGWWRHAKRDWRPTPLDPPAEGLTCRNDAWRFRIDRPEASRWGFRKARGVVVRLALAVAEESGSFAWVDVQVHSGVEQLSLAASAKRYRGWMEDGLEKAKAASFSAKARLGRGGAIGHSATGITKNGRVIRWRVILAERNDLVYTVSVRHDTGVGDAVQKDLDAIVGSFRYLDR